MLATNMPSASGEPAAPACAHKISALRLAFTGAVVAVVSFLLCWLVAVVAPSVRATHMYIQLFTPADVRSTSALAEGLCWSLVIGLITGVLGAFAYNLSARLERH